MTTILMPEQSVESEYHKSLWEKLFRRYFHDDILELANHFPDKRYLIVDYDLIEKAWKSITKGDEAIEYLRKYPEIALDDANKSLLTYTLPIPAPKYWDTSRVKITNYPNSVAIRDIRYRHLNTLVSITGVILRKTDVKYQIIRAGFKCVRCEHVTYVYEATGEYIEPYECENDVCGRKGPFKLIAEECIWADKRKIRLQETFEHITGGEQNLSALDAILLGDVECPPLGSIVTITGILKGIQTILNGNKTLDYYPLLEVNNIEAQDKERSIEITPSEVIELKKMAQDEHIIDRLVASTVPSVKGHDMVKEASLCCIVSPDNFLLPDGRKLRGYSHVMLCGDPSVAKSVLMQGFMRLVPRAQYAAGRSSSTKGLTVSVSKDKGGWGEGGWVAEAGMLVLADKALALIDELDKFEKEEQRDLNTVLEHAIIPVHRAGINRDYFARCPVISGLNPKFGRFDRYEPVVKQINVPPDTLSRFDLVFVMYDEATKKDWDTARHITNLWVKTTEVHNRNLDTLEDVTAAWGKDEFIPEISINMMRKWIAYSKSIKVRITPECAESIEKFFMAIRLGQSDDRNAGIPIVFRNLDGMMRLLICETRLRLSDVTEMRDVKRVINLIQESFKVMIDPATGKMDSDIINVGMGKSQRDRIKVLKEIIKELQEEFKGSVPIGEIVAKAVDAGLKEEDAEDMLKKLKTLGEVTEATEGRYRAV